MSGFAPSPAPRRSSRQSRAVHETPGKKSRFQPAPSATPAPREGSVTSDGMGMDIDESASIAGRSEIIDASLYAKSDELAVSFYATIPQEVKQVLKNADFYGEQYSGEIDTLTGFALVASSQTCFVWQHAQAVKGVPTCYIFSCPQDLNYNGPPLHALVPYHNATREPGLILASPSGEIRLWDSIGIGLAGGEHFSTTRLHLSPGEGITNFIRADVQSYIATTSTGRLYRLTLTSSGGKYHINTHIFAPPPTSMSFSRLIPSLWSSPSTTSVVPESGNISAVALGSSAAASTDVWALVDTRIQKWTMSSEGWEDVVFDEELGPMLGPELQKVFTSAPSDVRALDLELLDLAVETSGKEVVILLSYAGREQAAVVDAVTGIRRVYVLARVNRLGEKCKLLSMSSVPYQSTSNSGAPMHPRLQLLLDGAVVAIQFGDAVTLCSRETHYQDRLELKSATDRTFGVGVIQQPVSLGSTAGRKSTLLVLTSSTMVRATLDMDQIAKFDAETGRTNLIKSIMTQAILYGTNPENPLHFSFPPEVDEESLMLGAEQISRAVLASDPLVVRRNHDLSAQLSGRKERIGWLIQFINDNGVLTKMSQSCRQRLATDAEKLYASQELWTQHNTLSAPHRARSVLLEAIGSFMNEVDDEAHDDVMRAFFRLRVADIGRLLPHVLAIAMKAPHESGRSLEDSLPEANRVVLTVLKAAFDYREYNLGVYGIDLPMIKPWTSKPAVISILLALVDATTKLVESPAPGADIDRLSGEANAQLPELASLLFGCTQESLDWLDSPMAGDEAGTKRDYEELEVRFSQLRPEVLETLRRNGHAEHAFALAESHRDFRSLVALCHREIVYPPEDNPHGLRIRGYIERYADEFTNELYRWYVEHGELRVMFAQEEASAMFMDSFFVENPNPSVSWIHDLGKGRHGAASEALLTESQYANELDAKHLMLSIGKLAHLAQLHASEGTVDENVLDAFHDDLDFISVHERLLKELRAPLAPVRGARGKLSLDGQIDRITEVKASQLTQGSSLQNVFKQLVRQLLQGKALSIEEAVDVLTLKDNVGTLDDYVTALHLLSRDKDLPEARRASAFCNIWRRIYMHDDWVHIRQTASVTDEELIQKFQQTALHTVLCSTITTEPAVDGYDLTPEQASMTPSPTEIASRWPGMPVEHVEQLFEEYASEAQHLQSLDLGDIYGRVRELAQEAAATGV